MKVWRNNIHPQPCPQWSKSQFFVHPLADFHPSPQLLTVFQFVAWPAIPWISIINLKLPYMQSESDQFQPSSNPNSKSYHPQQPSSDQLPDDHNSDHNSQQHQSNSEQSFDEDEQLSDSRVNRQESMEREIMRAAVAGEERRKPFQREIVGEIVDKLKEYEEVAVEKEGEELVTLRIQQLVYEKLLVLTYGCSDFRLVLAHFHLGSAYLRHECYDQAIEHIFIALHKNEKLFEQLPRTKQLQCTMQNILAECFIKKSQYDDAIHMLQKSIELAQNTFGGENEEVVNRSRILLAQCESKHGNYAEALKIIEKVLQKTKQSKNQEQYAFALVEKANILAADKKYDGAIAAQDQAINILIVNNYPKPEDVAEMYAKLGDYFDLKGNSESSLSCIQKVKTLYQQIYSPDDKRVIKARRRIATSLLKNERFKEAVNELLEIIELEEKIFGESSLQAARTLKLLGTVYIRLETGDARSYLKRAMGIFNAHGAKKQVQEIKEKLKILMQNSNGNNELKILSEQDL